MKTIYKFGLIFAFIGNAHAATVTPKITKISITPTSAIAGTKFKFIAELDNPLPTGYKVKIKLTNTLISMAGIQTSYSLSRAIYTTGSQTYKVGIYNAKNALQGKVSSGNYRVSSAASLNHAPTLVLIKAETTATTNTVYTVTLNAKDVDVNLSSITMNWGDNSEPETLAATDDNDLVFSHIYTSASSFGWNAFASDKGTPALNSKSVSKLVTVSAPVVEVIAPPAKTTGYTKIANDGSELPDSAVLGTNSTDWACTKDNKTGLIWEVKTNDGGLRDRSKIYSNYTASSPKCTSGCDTSYNKAYPLGKYGDITNSDGFVNAVNKNGLCGATDWRMPERTELMQLVYCPDGQYLKETLSSIFIGNDYISKVCNVEPPYTIPSINATFFPDIVDSYSRFWTSSVWWSEGYQKTENVHWDVFFGNGSQDVAGNSLGYYVRLVRNPAAITIPSVKNLTWADIGINSQQAELFESMGITPERAVSMNANLKQQCKDSFNSFDFCK